MRGRKEEVIRMCYEVCVIWVCEVVDFFVFLFCICFFFQAEDGIRVLVRSRGLGDVYKRQHLEWPCMIIRKKWIRY